MPTSEQFWSAVLLLLALAACILLPWILGGCAYRSDLAVGGYNFHYDTHVYGWGPGAPPPTIPGDQWTDTTALTSAQEHFEGATSQPGGP